MTHGWGLLAGGQARRLPMQTDTVLDDELESTFELDSEAPFYIEPILAWRAWSVCAPGVCDCFEKKGRGRALIRSITYPIPWLRRRATRAHCIHCWKRNQGTVENTSIHHSAPDAAHKCGIYAVNDPSLAIEWGEYTKQKFTIIGEVLLWGKVFQYQEGYIAEFAYPASFYIPDHYGYYVRENGTPEKGKPMIEPEEIAYMLVDAYAIDAVLGWDDFMAVG